MRYVFALILWLLPMFVLAQDWEDQSRFESPESASVLRILSSTDTALFAPIIEAFIVTHPRVSVEYFVTGTAQIDDVFRNAPERFDVVISSAMDLQLKLVNDGYAMALPDLGEPEWAHWHDSLFAFTAEPATIVINRSAFPDGEVPATRRALVQALRARPDVFRGRVGTYDVRASGLGYLFATQDARASETYWRLMEVMGGLDAQLYCCSGEMIDDLISGNLLVAYNVLGSYVAAREDRAELLEIVLPSDFPTIMMRTAFVSDQTKRPSEAADFVQHLLEIQQGVPDAAKFPLPSLAQTPIAMVQSVISLEPALMTYLDPLKRRTFLKEWSSAIIQ
ncbi:ABC transporter substrate-binding protein [Shimia sp. R11_0]|uniref:ABC transporter substrate-binding protein n=1 Tax=Shimia sp. R11_0 TaxID=2821096 RepID=UPI001AD9FECB|nr:ABC transporter substrate-binding protein [Shimia sp. R11_0]MBO9476474.1 ABC transporter substrate-binding protein [Shimia sp. R11_0]